MISVSDYQDQIVEIINSSTAVNRNSDGAPADLGSQQIENLDKKYFALGLYKINIRVLLNTCFGIYTKRFFSEARRQNRSIVCLYEDFDNAASEKKIEYKTK